MNVVNPPVFDHIVAFGAGSWVPFEDAYPLSPATITAKGNTTVTAARIRDYSTCKGVNLSITNAPTNTIKSSAFTNAGGNADYILTPNINQSGGTVEIITTCYNFTSNQIITAKTVIISGWAPAP